MNQKSLIVRVKEGVVLLDGGMGTALMGSGLPAGAPGESWNLDDPNAVESVHAGFIEAGCDVVQTNTFGGTRIRLEHHGLADKAKEINKAAVAIARRAAGEAQWVAGNIGPSGLFLPPVGDADPSDLENGYLEQARWLAEAGVDSISIETMLDLKEARIALKAARKGAPDLPVSVCMIFEKKKRGFFSPMGDKPEEALRVLAEEGADFVGANCSMGSLEMKEIVESVVAAVPVPVVMKPNAGLPEHSGGQVIYKQTPEEFAEDLACMVRCGARLVGGCCGTDERFLAALRRALDRL